MQSFFPENCYPGESAQFLEFYKRWCGYNITGERNEQKCIFVTGRGANGKSVLSMYSLFVWGEEICNSIDMSRFAQGTAANNDPLFNCRNVRSIIVSENSDKRNISEEMFKKLVGGDPIDVSAKYKNAVTCRFPGKLTFFQNDSPIWSSTDSTPIRRRIWNLPMRAQHLRKVDVLLRRKLEKEGNGRFIIDIDETRNIEQELQELHVQAYMKWCVEGAVAHYASGVGKAVPPTVQATTDQESRDKAAEFYAFVHEHIIRVPGGFISSAEIKEVFLIDGNFDTSTINDSTESDLYGILRKILDPSQDFKNSNGADAKYRGVTKDRKYYPGRDYPGRGAGCQMGGYLGIGWKAGPIAGTVNALRKEYVKHKLPDISYSAAAPDDEEPDTPKEEEQVEGSAPKRAKLADIFAKP